MARYSHDELRSHLGGGLLSFPVTHTTASGEFDEGGYREHLAWLGTRPLAGLFAAGGTGEFFSWHPDDVTRIVRAAVTETAGRVPVIAPAGYGTRIAVRMARQAEEDGADALLLLPPYLVEPDPEGLAAHVRAVCAASSLGVIVYHRANAVYGIRDIQRLAEDCPTLIGVKDGVGDIELMAALHALLPDRLLTIGGLPTAETYALPYREIGVSTYSSAIFNFAPDFALAFFAAVRRGDRGAADEMLARFVLPYVAIRRRRPGYAVAIVKAAMRAIGRPAGPVLPPLSDLLPEDEAELVELIDRAGVAS